jgi:myo-inositol-1-phosphate synthase
VVLGTHAIARRLTTGGGLVTELPEPAPLGLVGVGDLAFGGWDIAPTGMVAQARALAADDAAVPESLVAKLEPELPEVEGRVTPGFANGGGPAARPRKTHVRLFRAGRPWRPASSGSATISTG